VTTRDPVSSCVSMYGDRVSLPSQRLTQGSTVQGARNAGQQPDYLVIEKGVHYRDAQFDSSIFVYYPSQFLAHDPVG